MDDKLGLGTKTHGEPTPAIVDAKAIRTQFGLDLYGKEVQSAATYSYLWMADQMGHIGLGLLIVNVLMWLAALADLLLPKLGMHWQVWTWLPPVIAGAGVAAWEVSVYRTFSGKATGLFPDGNALIAKNAVVATLYMEIGVVAAYAWHLEEGWAAGISLALVGAAVALAPFWLRQKIVWQKAGLPYLSRLANARNTISADDAKALQKMLDRNLAARRSGKPMRPGPVVILTGPPNAGKTALTCGIGTECAFGGLKVRYTTFDKLAQMAHVEDDDCGPPNILYWLWTQSEVLLIDDIDGGGSGYLRIDEFQSILHRDFGAYGDFLRKRMTVWVLGEKQSDTDLQAWVDAIVARCSEDNIQPECMVVRFFREAPEINEKKNEERASLPAHKRNAAA